MGSSSLTAIHHRVLSLSLQFSPTRFHSYLAWANLAYLVSSGYFFCFIKFFWVPFEHFQSTRASRFFHLLQYVNYPCHTSHPAFPVCPHFISVLQVFMWLCMNRNSLVMCVCTGCEEKPEVFLFFYPEKL